MQTCRDFDVVFLDNASSDGSAQLAKRLLLEADLPFRTIRRNKPAGIAANLNRLLKEASGELVAPLSTDDWYGATYVESVIAAARTFPDAAMIAVNGWSEYEQDGTSIVSNIPAHPPEMIGTRFLDDREAFFWVGVCYRREVLQTLRGWDEEQKIEDIDLIFRITSRHKIAQLAEPLVHYRRSSQSVSLDPDFMTRGRMAFFSKHRRHFANGYSDRMAELLRSGAAVCIDQGRSREAAGFLLQALAIRPLNRTNWRTATYLLRSALRR